MSPPLNGDPCNPAATGFCPWRGKSDSAYMSLMTKRIALCVGGQRFVRPRGYAVAVPYGLPFSFQTPPVFTKVAVFVVPEGSLATRVALSPSTVIDAIPLA